MSSSLLIDEPPLLVIPSLVIKLGKVISMSQGKKQFPATNEAIFVQQLHYWMQRSNKEVDGRKWVFNSFTQWHEQIPFLSEKTIQRIVATLKSIGLITVSNFNQKGFDHTNWYSIDYDVLDQIERIPLDDDEESKKKENLLTENETKNEGSSMRTTCPDRSNSQNERLDDVRSSMRTTCPDDEVNLSISKETTCPDDEVNLSSRSGQLVQTNTIEYNNRLLQEISHRIQEKTTTPLIQNTDTNKDLKEKDKSVVDLSVGKAKKLAKELSVYPNAVERFIKDYGVDMVLEKLAILRYKIKGGKKIKEPAKYLFTLLKNPDWVDDDMLQKEERRRENEKLYEQAFKVDEPKAVNVNSPYYKILTHLQEDEKDNA